MEIKKVLKNTNVDGKRVLVRADLDVGDDFSQNDVDKLKTIVPTIEYLLERKCKLVLIGHRGRPDGVRDDKLSLQPVTYKLQELLGRNILFLEALNDEAKKRVANLEEGNVAVLENLRFDAREEKNDDELAKSLSELGEVFINEAFSSSHRSHSSIVGLPKFLPSAIGLRFEKEIDNLSKVIQSPTKPVIVIVSGLKEDKLEYVEPFSRFADKILIAGRLPEIIDIREIGKASIDPQLREKIVKLVGEGKVLIADLIQDKEDITMHSMENFVAEIETAGTIVVGGPVGKFEDEGHRQGTKVVFEAIAKNEGAFKIAGGGDTEQAIKLLDLTEKFDWISVGGGASLDFLATGTLPGIDAINK